MVGANQNTGPTVSFTGMAPKVYLGNYKVEGQVTGASEDVLVQALNDAFNDGFDIANCSLGSLALTGPLDTGATCGPPPCPATSALSISRRWPSRNGGRRRGR